MTDMDQQVEQLREAVDEKSEPTDDSRPQDVDPRHKGHVTAET